MNQNNFVFNKKEITFQHIQKSEESIIKEINSNNYKKSNTFKMRELLLFLENI